MYLCMCRITLSYFILITLARVWAITLQRHLVKNRLNLIHNMCVVSQTAHNWPKMEFKIKYTKQQTTHCPYLSGTTTFIWVQWLFKNSIKEYNMISCATITGLDENIELLRTKIVLQFWYLNMNVLLLYRWGGYLIHLTGSFTSYCIIKISEIQCTMKLARNNLLFCVHAIAFI